jgi:DNA topoisomerase II
MLVQTKQVEVSRVTNKVRFLELLISRELVISKKSKADVNHLLESFQFHKHPLKKPSHGESAQDLSYEYLLQMQVWNLTLDGLEILEARKARKEQELQELLEKSTKEMWVHDLDAFLLELDNIEAAKTKK